MDNEQTEQIEEQSDIPVLPGRNFTGINLGGNTVTQSSEHLSDEQKLLVRWLYTFARDKKLTWPQLADAVKISQSTLSRIWTDTYRVPKGQPNAGDRVPLDNVCEKIARYKKLVTAREAISQSGFIETSVWGRVDWLCSRAFLRQKIGFIYGESQISKTTCLLEHTHRNNSGQTTYVEMPPSAGVQLMTRCIAKALHVNTQTSYEKLIDDVLDALDESKLLIMDEIHRVFTTYQKNSVMRCLDVLRYIHDQSKCGLVLCGTNVFRDQLSNGEFFQYLKQLRRRGLYELQLPTNPPRADLDLVAEKFGLPPAEDDAEEIMLRIAKLHGFGKFMIRLTDAAERAAKKKEKLTWSHFIHVHNVIEKMARGDSEDEKGDRI